MTHSLEQTVIFWLDRFRLNYVDTSAEELKGLVQVWTEGLSQLSPSQVDAACDLAYEECEDFPSLEQIKSRIPQLQ